MENSTKAPNAGMKEVAKAVRRKLTEIHRSRMQTAYYLSELRVINAVAQEGFFIGDVEMIPEEVEDRFRGDLVPTGFYAGFKVGNDVYKFPHGARIRMPVQPEYEPEF